MNIPNENIPLTASLVAPRNELNFLHSASAVISNDWTAFRLYCFTTSTTPGWLKSAFTVRDKISQHFNVEKIVGFSGRTPEQAPAVGEKLDFFTVEAISDEKLVLTSRDSHLAVMVSIDLIGQDTREAFITTSVKTFNTFGRLYMLPVAPAHGVIIKRMLSRLPRSGSDDGKVWPNGDGL